MNATIFQSSASIVKYYCRAKYYRTPDGALKLAQVQHMSIPAFRVNGYELVKPDKLNLMFEEAEEKDGLHYEEHPPDPLNRLRALRRAKISAFDKILCNPDLNTFATFTLSPEAVADRANYDDCYKALATWLKNGVARHGLKYVVCPERHKQGGIHFHGLMNSSALKLVSAKNPYTGEKLLHNGQQLYNLSTWKYGFSSAVLIDTNTIDRERVSKYIFKYMGKQGIDGLIGGRYVLSGGKFTTPIYLYGNDPKEFQTDGETGAHTSEHDGIIYREWTYI